MNHQRTLTRVYTDVKILKRILANQIEDTLKRIIHYDQMEFILCLTPSINTERNISKVYPCGSMCWYLISFYC